MRRILTVLGTRPEAIKLAPVLEHLDRSAALESAVCVTAQHRRLLDEVLELYGIRPRWDLDAMREDQSLAEVTGRLALGLDPVLAEHRPDLVLVQGDTTTCLVGALAAFYRRIPVAHVEAGLRSGSLAAPFPEELNRRLVSRIAALHFAPTPAAEAALRMEGCTEVHMVGNTIVDAVQGIARRLDAGTAGPRAELPPELVRAANGEGPLVLVTCHRRESFGAPLREVARALEELVRSHPGARFVLPVHPNPNVHAGLAAGLPSAENLLVTDPLPYPAFVRLLRGSTVVLTDSGGVQEEAATLGVPLLVLREHTERPEVALVGAGLLVGTCATDIVAAATRLLGDAEARRAMAEAPNPFGDGQAAVRIARLLGAADPSAPAA